MLKIVTRTPEPAPNLRNRPEESGFDLTTVVDLLQRQWALIGAALALAIVFGAIYVMTAPPRYTAKAVLMLDTRRVQPVTEHPVLNELSFDTTLVDSQLEILKSENIARSVVNDLKLDQDPEFVGSTGSLFGSLTGAIRQLINLTSSGADVDAPLSDSQRVRLAVNRISDGLSVQRVKRTYVLEIAFQSLEPGKAARIANAVADAYILDQMQAKYAATKRASTWLQERLTELRQEAITADRAVQDYRAKNNLVETGGRLISEQQLEKMNSELVQARAQTAEAKARLDRILEIDVAGATDATVTDSLRNEVINRLRSQYLDASKRSAEFTARYGRNHHAVVKLREEMEQIKTGMMDELRRIGEAYKSDYEISRARGEALQADLDGMVRQSAGTNQSEVSLRVLQSSAQSYRSLYDTFLQRFVEATQQQSFPTTEARVITPASHAERTHPRVLIAMAVATVLGLFGGVGGALAREQLDRVLKTPKQLEQALGVECLGILPVISKNDLKQKRSAPAEPAFAVPQNRAIDQTSAVERQVVNSPFSRFAETLRGIKVAADMRATVGKDGVVIGIISALPTEGKSTVAANLAQLLTSTGAPTILIDGDLRHPSLSRRLAPNAKAGILEALNGETNYPDLLWRDAATGLYFLPAVVPSPIAHTADILASPEMEELISDIRSQHKYVVVDFPPLGPVVDAKAAGDLIDAFLLVVEWGRTSPITVCDVLASADVVQAKMLGAVLNKADLSALKRLEPHKSYGYYEYYTYGSSR